MNIETALTTATADLLGMSDSPRLDAELLLIFALGEQRSHLYAHADRVLNRGEHEQFMSMVMRRADGEPIAYLTGEKEFWSLPLTVTVDTLIPRPETELLVEQALSRIPKHSTTRLLDLGTGSGAIAVAIASERPQCSVVATDISASALAIARSNGKRYQLTNISFLEGDWLAPVSGQMFDIIVSNPPYVAYGDAGTLELSHEPAAALIAGEDGLAAIRKIATDAGAHLVETGTLLIEHGANQEVLASVVLAENGWTDIRCFPDLQHLPRVTIATVGMHS